jgi:transposase InsO family protein
MERLLDAGIEPSVGSVGDSYDNALAETVIGLFKTEVIRQRGPWRSLEAVEYATIGPAPVRKSAVTTSHMSGIPRRRREPAAILAVGRRGGLRVLADRPARARREQGP